MTATLLLGIALLIVSLVPGEARAAELISAFEGSELRGEYEADYDRVFIAQAADPKPEILTVEGRVHSRIYSKPEGKSAREIFLSYERELEAAGFEILLAWDKSQGDVKQLVYELYGDKANALADRKYTGATRIASKNDKGRLITFAAAYLSARKTTADATYHVVVVIGRENYFYAIETMESAAMEADTVKLSPELLDEKLESEGHFAIYGISFATNSATIEPASQATLQVIADVLRRRANDRFYVVGHTDDTGTMAHNLDLSTRRAESVAKALADDFGIAAFRIEARGVGPLSPIEANGSEAGRERNRRVELVRRLEK